MSVRTPIELRRFVQSRDSVEAVVQRCGAATWDLVLVDPKGNWTRWVFTSDTAAEAVAEDLEIRVHHGWDDAMTKRMNRRDHWNEPGGQKRAR